MGGKFKLQVQDSDLEYLSWRFDKHIALPEKKIPLIVLELVVGSHRFMDFYRIF